jgi:methyl-accepting chemotaxis protein
VGGGNAGCRLFQILHHSQLARPGFVVDPRPDAPAILAVTEEDQQRTRGEVSREITLIEQEISQNLDGSRNVVGQINQIMNTLQMLALNASIEAAKVGIHGKGFMVVADHMAKSVDAVRRMTHEIEAMNGNIQNVSEKIDLALERLK